MIKRVSSLFAAICLMSQVAWTQDTETAAKWDEAAAIGNFNTCYRVTSAPTALEECNFTKECIENSPQGSTALGVYSCLQKDGELWDEKLNFEYNRLLKHLGPWVHNKKDPVMGLRKAERAWIMFRDADCQSQFERSPVTGGYAGATYESCKKVMTARRALDFRSENQRHASR